MPLSAGCRPCSSDQPQEPAITRSNWREHSCRAASGVVGPGGGAAGSRAKDSLTTEGDPGPGFRVARKPRQTLTVLEGF